MSPGMNEREPDLDDLVIEKEATRKPGRAWKILAFIVGAALILFSLGTYLTKGPASHATRVQVTHVQRLSPSSAQGLLTATGYVVAQRQASVASKATGRLTSVRIDVGDRVTEGEILATLEQADIQVKLLQTQARLDVAKAALANAQPELREATLHYQRIKALWDKGLVTLAELDTAEARLRRARASIRSSRSAVKLAQTDIQAVKVDVENTLIRAPFDGTVMKKFAEVGEIVAPMSGASQSRGSVAAIADLRTLQVEAEVSESFLNSVFPGQTVHIALDAVPDHVYHGSVSQIVPTADRTKATIPVKIRIDDLDEKVFPDMSATVTFRGPSSPASREATSPDATGALSDAMGVLPDAIVTRTGQTMVLLVENNVVSEVPVETGAPIHGLIPIQGNVDPGNPVVLSPSEDLVAGSMIQEHSQE